MKNAFLEFPIGGFAHRHRESMAMWGSKVQYNKFRNRWHYVPTETLQCRTPSFCRVVFLSDLVNNYHKTSNISRTLVGNEIVANSDVVGASPVGAAPTTSSFSTEHLASMDWAKVTTRRYQKHLSFGIWCDLYQRFTVVRIIITDSIGCNWYTLIRYTDLRKMHFSTIVISALTKLTMGRYPEDILHSQIPL